MAFDGLVTYTICNELQRSIIGGKIDKIFEPNSNEIILGIYCNGIKYALDIVVSSNNYRICLTTSSKPNPMVAPNFCMVLRKHLLNTKITNIYTLSLERLVIIEFEGRNKSGDYGTKKIVAELMGKHSNIILMDSDNTIIDSLRHFKLEDNSYRNILPNYKYSFPISNKLDFCKIKDKDDFYDTTYEFLNKNLADLHQNLKISDIISDTYTGISKTSMLSIIEQLQLVDNFNKENMSLVYNYLYDILNGTRCFFMLF